MAEKRDYYEILGIDRNASADDIKGAYRKAALKWHPDRWVNGTDAEKKTAEERFKEASEAYSVLSDPTRRPVTTNSVSPAWKARPARTSAAASATSTTFSTTSSEDVSADLAVSVVSVDSAEAQARSRKSIADETYVQASVSP